MATMAENVIAAGSETRPLMLEKDEFDKFTSELGESIHSYYLRYAKLINDMNMIPMSMTPMQINTKFVNHVQPEWNRFVTAAKQERDLHSSPPLQSFAPTVVQQPPTIQTDNGFIVPTFLPTDDPIESLNKAMIFLSSVYRSKFPPTNKNSSYNSKWPRARVSNTVGNARVNQPRVVKCYNCNGEGHIAKRTRRKRVKDFEWFKEKMLLAQAQEA
ncbi:retrovirus-related pol polyprotein from transposon TNT 1-94 [Tanacetum coccineum]